MIVCAGKSESFEFAKPIGIGLVESAINLTKLCLKQKPNHILFIGSAGSYGRAKIFDVVESCSASNVELSFLQNFTYSPISLHVEWHSPYVSRETVNVNCSNYITKDCSSLHVKSEIENMEFYSVLSVAKEFNIPAFGLFVVTNYCDVNAHVEFIKNHQKAKEMLEDIVLTKYKELL